MLTVPYSRVLDEAVEMWSGEGSASVADATLFNKRVRVRAVEFWERFFWPEWTLVEYRQFRQSWNAGTNYVPPTSLATLTASQVFWPQTLAYYQCLQPCTNQPPTSQTTEGWQTNDAYWTLCQGDYYGLPLWEMTGTYTPPNRVIDPTVRLPYQCIGTPAAGAVPSQTPAGWSRLYEFERSIAFTQSWEASTIAATRKVWDLNPYIHNNARETPFAVRGKEIVCRGRAPVAWVEFRLPAPDWYGAVWSSTAAYAAGAQIYFNNGAGSDYYVCGSAGAAAGQSPSTNPSLWSIVSFPYVLRDAAPQAAYADVLKIDGQTDRAVAELAEANRMIQMEYDKLERQQGQTRPLKAVNSFNANQFWS